MSYNAQSDIDNEHDIDVDPDTDYLNAYTIFEISSSFCLREAQY